MQRSILSFFSKVSGEKKESHAVGSSLSSDNVGTSSKTSTNVNADEDSSLRVTRHKKRRLVFDSSDDEKEDSSCDISDLSQKKSIANLYSCPNKRFARDLTNSPKLSSLPAGSKSRSVGHIKKCYSGTPNDTFAMASCFGLGPNDGSRSFAWPHLTYQFLLPDRIKDAFGRCPSHPDYDPRTLFVPEDFIRKQSPALRQWWILKSQNFDTLLFFKMGKFYELYHMDAVIAVEELKLTYMKGEFAHSGFPEIAFQRMADHLLHRGYKVARVEQTETPEAMAKRISGHSGVDKVVRREICQVITPGTWFAPLRNGISSDNALDAPCTTSSQSANYPEMETDLSFNRYLLVLLVGSDSERSETQLGIALLKAATGEIMVSSPPLFCRLFQHLLQFLA
ncbi:unnamed protein product [Hydatigera taeniaeformis]|uniref:MutS_I domain-containing protein n=1 Tax=Hydatigena taeniaeformis TaxID=6205 RepID=A0A0R3XBX8_HYDTA|nr:unnamed protein product [Hydatigera taeniaeformis]